MTDAAKKQSSPLALAALFTVILALIFFSFKFYSESSVPPVPKYAFVLWIGVWTALEAGLVMRISMHLKHEKKLIVGLATLPFLTVLLTIFPTLIDIMTLKGHNQTYNIVHDLRSYSPHAHPQHDSDEALASHPKAKEAAEHKAEEKPAEKATEKEAAE